MNRLFIASALAVAVSSTAAADLAEQLANYRMVDLSHSYDESTLFWPTSPIHFKKTELAFGETDGGYFYSSYSFCAPEHGGTHLDAPLHFSASGRSTEKIPLSQMIAPGVVIDVSAKAATDRNYRVSRADVLDFERRFGRIDPGTIVLIHSGWSQYWPDAKAYLGDDTAGDASKLQFPGLGEAATRLLVEKRQVSMVGIDTASIDYGPSKDFIVHRVAMERNVAALENLTGLEKLPATGFLMIALPVKIGGGSGGPVRAVALVPR